LVFLLAILAVTRYGGILFALPVGVVSIQAFDWYFLPPIRPFDKASLFVLGLFLLMSVTVGVASARTGRRAELSEEARGALANEQAALRRVATLVARQGAPADVFAAVPAEVAGLFAVPVVALFRFEPDFAATAIAGSEAFAGHVGRSWRFPTGDESVLGAVRTTGRPVRNDDYRKVQSAATETVDDLGLGAILAVPVIVDGPVWGAIALGIAKGRPPLPEDTFERVAAFTELVATAISNAEARTELTASRARVVTAADETRKRLERDLHDGIQQRLVTLALKLRATEAMTPRPSQAVLGELSDVADGLGVALEELREISRGIHPAILTEGGLEPALKALARRSVVPTELRLRLEAELQEPLQVAAYYIVSEALTNAAKHAQASVIELRAEALDGVLELEVRDDGVGGADVRRGSGLIGLRDRVEALGGTISVVSPVGDGTTMYVQLPVHA
jgi:signal transduction histidine kinase